MSIANNNVVAKIAALAAGLALVGSSFAFAVPAQAATTAELEAQVAALLAQLQAMQGGAATAGVAFTMDMTIGASGAEVTRLQNWLIGKGHTIPAGATGYFGAQTAAALGAYQAANGITPAVGYFGPITRAKVNATLGTGGSTGGSTGGNTGGGLEGGAGSLDDADFISNLNNEEVGEDEEAEIAGLELEADDNSDLEFTAVRVSFHGTSTANSEDLDDYADSISIWFDGEEVASEDVDDMNENGGVWSTTLSLDSGVIARAGETAELVVSVTALSNIDSSDLGDNAWGVRFDSVRYMDAQGAVVTEDSLGDIGGDQRDFEFATFTSANDVEFNVDESSDTPEEGTVEVDEDGGDEVVLLIGEMDAEGSDLEISELTASITTAGTGTGDAGTIAEEYILVIDGDEVATIDSDECETSTTCNGSAAATAVYVFDDFEFMLDDGDMVEFEIRAVLNEVDGTVFAEGDSITVTVAATGVEVEDESGDELGSERDGTANGETQTLRSSGLAAEFDEDASGASFADNVGTFKFVLDLTAFGEEIDNIVNDDFEYTVVETATAGGDASDLLEAESSVEKNGAQDFALSENEDGTFTFTVFIATAEAGDAGTYTVTLDAIDLGADGGTDITIIDESLSTFVNYQS